MAIAAIIVGASMPRVLAVLVDDYALVSFKERVAHMLDGSRDPTPLCFMPDYDCAASLTIHKPPRIPKDDDVIRMDMRWHGPTQPVLRTCAFAPLVQLMEDGGLMYGVNCNFKGMPYNISQYGRSLIEIIFTNAVHTYRGHLATEDRIHL